MRAALLLALAVAAAAAGAGPARSQGATPAPWRPAGGDSLSLWASQSRALLQGAKGDALTQVELDAYRLQDRIARAYFRQLGPRRMEQAGGLRAVFDSLRLSARVSRDESLPTFVLVQYLNPHFENYASLAYLYWFRGDELRSQPIDLKGGRDAELRVFWSGNDQAPYEAGILFYQGFGRERSPELYYFHLQRRGDAWLPVQVGDQDLRLGDRGTAAWVDLDRDAKPELFTWTQGGTDSIFVPCTDPGCPELITERIFVRASGRFRLYEQRSVASPYATLVLFLRALGRRDEAFARSLALSPRVIEQARELGWVGLRRRRALAPLPAATGVRWPDRLRFQYAAPGRGTALVEVRFVNEQGHWFLTEIVPLVQPPAAGSPG